MLIIDSCMWAYYFDEDAREHPFVVDVVDESLRLEKIAINTVIIVEVAHFLVKSLGAVIGRAKLNVFLGFPFLVVDLDYDLMLRSLELLMKYSHLGIGGRDSTIMAVMERLDFSEILTHDEAFKRVDWMKVIDPIPEKIEN